jgi:AraC-like DNA-binding protein
VTRYFLETLEVAGDLDRRCPSSGGAEVAGRDKVSVDWVELGRQLIENQALTPIPLKRVLGEIPYSYEHFHRLFKARHGQTPHAYREGHRLAWARRFLAEEGQSITRMAYTLGYSSSQHFATNFKKRVGLTPREYRAVVNNG